MLLPSLDQQFYRDEHLFVHLRHQVVMLDSDVVTLTPIAYHLLALLVEHAGEVVPRAIILKQIWDDACGTSPHRVDFQIRRLRRKLGAYSDQYIETVIGVGYRFRPFLPRDWGSRWTEINSGAMAIGGGQLGHAWSESSIKAYAPQSSGVYAIYSAGVYAIYSAVWIYIGESDDIQRRLLEHWSGDNTCITSSVPTGFVFELRDREERERRWAALIARFRPRCNQLTVTAGH